MRHLIYFILLLVISCTTNSQVLIEKINNHEIAELLIFGESQDLNKLQIDIEKNLWVKIYKTPSIENNKCFPESHGICRYKYYIATSQLDDSPIINAYYIGAIGEIIDIKWVHTETIDKAVINIITNKYSKEALAYNKSLKNKITNYQIIATQNNLLVTKVKK